MLLTILHVWAIALLLLGVAGYGPGRWLTPPALKPYELWLTPLWGYGLLSFVAYYGLNTVLTLRAALPVALTLAVALGAWRLRPWRRSAVDRVPRAPLGETLLVGAIALIAAGIGVVPLLRAGYLLPIGHGWDIEFYLPLAQYLQDYTYPRLAEAPVAPLLGVIDVQPTNVRAIGFSYLHGMIDLIGGWQPAGTFPLLMALMRGLAMAPVYLLLRVGLRASVAGAALGTLLVALNELLQWISFNNFAMHVSSMPLVPLATLLTLLALYENQPSSKQSLRERVLNTNVLSAIAATTMIALSYHPALLAYGALAAGLGLWALIANRDKIGTLLRGITIIVGCLILGALAHWRAPRAFFDVYQSQSPSIGGTRFARLTELFGTGAFHHLTLAVDDPAWLTPLSWVALGALVVGIVAAVWRNAAWRGPALGLLGFALFYALGLRFVIAFAYGYYKGVSYLSFVPLGVAGVGLAGLVAARVPAARKQRSITPPAQASALIFRPALVNLQLVLGGSMILLVLATTAWSTYRLLETYRVPVLAGRDTVDFTAALRAVPDDRGTILLVDDPEMRGPQLGLTMLGLYNHPWIGRGQAGFALFNRPEPGLGAQYALMHVSEDPRAWGFAPQDVVARGQRMALYRAPTGAQAFVSGTDAAYTRATGARLNSLQVQDLTHGDFRTAQPDQPLQFFVQNDRLQWGAAATTQPERGGVIVLDVASATTQVLTLTVNGAAQTFDLPTGVSRVTTPVLNVAATISLTSAGDPVVVRSVQLFAPDAQLAMGVAAQPDTIAVQTTTQPAAQSATTTISAIGAQPDVLQATLEVYELTEGTSPRRYAGGTFAVRANEPAQLALDLQTPAATLNGGSIGLQTDALADGNYFAALWLYQGANLVQRVPFLRFERRDGRVVDVQSLDANATFARFSLPQSAVEATLGPARVTGYSLSGPLQAGSEAQLDVQWQVNEAVPDEPLLVFAQILSPDDRKWAAWDGAAGGDWWPSPAWRAGDRVWQTIPLKLDPTTPPGRYRLAIGLYRASSGERLAVAGPQAQNGLIVLGEIDIAR